MTLFRENGLKKRLNTTAVYAHLMSAVGLCICPHTRATSKFNIRDLFKQMALN